jgi:hypothetical protein
MLTISVRDGESFYVVKVTPKWADKYDNGAVISCGLTVPVDISRQAFERYRKRYPDRVVNVSRDEYQHSGCQSSCIRQGARECRW